MGAPDACRVFRRSRTGRGPAAGRGAGARHRRRRGAAEARHAGMAPVPDRAQAGAVRRAGAAPGR
eukprot:scaffold30434_cov129-Isochrysis_galbana.AAC.1